MAKQTIEIEVPEGKKAVWDEKHGRIEFVQVDRMEDIKTFDDALNYLKRNGICEELISEYEASKSYSYSEKLCQYRIVVAALTNNEERSLTTGEVWFPLIQFCRPKDVKNCWGNEVVGYIESNGQRYAVVGGHTYRGATAGLGSFSSGLGVSGSWACVGFRSVSSEKVAKYISKQFGRLLFEVHYGGTNCNWHWTK